MGDAGLAGARNRLQETDARELARLFGWARLALGVAALLVPRVPAVPWVGRRGAAEPSTRVFARALGARDVALGLGAVLAVDRQEPVRAWVEAGGLADAGDCLTTLLHWRSLPRAGRWSILAMAGTSTGFSLYLSRRLTRS